MTELWVRSGCPDLHRSRKTPDLVRHPRWAEAFATALKVIQAGGMVSLIGERGTGKTQIGVECAKSVVRDMKSALYTQAQELIAKIYATYNGKGDEATAIKSFITPHLLILDEQQERRHTEDENRLLTYVLDRRYSSVKPTIIVSNAQEEQFRGQVGPSVWDRIHESGVVLVCNWPSFRVHHGEAQEGT